MLVKDFTNAQVLDSYAGKRVFITGHTGFKGSWLCVMLQKAGAILKGFAFNSVFSTAVKKRFLI